jgi:hypothetical protein
VNWINRKRRTANIFLLAAWKVVPGVAVSMFLAPATPA